MTKRTLHLDGTVLRPGTDDYDNARRVWNAMIDRRPALIARCAHTGDVRSAVLHAREHGLPLAVRGGGHNIAGLGTCEDGLLIDLSSICGVEVDPGRQRVKAGGGAVLAQVDEATQPHALALPSGIISSTGLGGLTLGGGMGWLARRHGLTCDSLIEAEVVDADGQVRLAGAGADPDLLWALRGGGGNFGVVTSLTFTPKPAGPIVWFGPTVYAYRDAGVVLRAYRDFATAAPRECCVWVDLLHAPPLPFLPPKVHGTPVVSVLQCYLGDGRAAAEALAPLRGAAKPVGDAFAARPYSEAQRMFDQAYGPGMRNYWSAHNLMQLSDAAIEVIVEAAADLPTPTSDIMLHQLGGAIDDVPLDTAAYPHRGVAFAVTPGARWSEPADDARCVAWARGVHQALTPYASGTAYANFISDPDGAGRVAYGGHLPRLRELKRRYDPDNVFRLNQNIAPG